ncbi:hypothetical protein M9H77_31067 [Catharanthus roseus]|uniref:Uncharacterized protein n=1 Tax=Catharanthus roseus TaxID=4058 RepID=A0ACC0A034_CATRO|nr:hypothetical protein M9H77_31067 [Catharanthus roseus]
MRWRIGNGHSVRIWEDKWLTIPHTFKLSSQPHLSAFDCILKVSSLIDFEQGSWKYGLIQCHFKLYEANEILKVPLCDDWPRDEQIWAYNKSGPFSVLSAYRIILQAKTNLTGGKSSSTSCISYFWTQLWGLCTAPKAEIAPDRFPRPKIRQSAAPSPDGYHWRPSEINSFKLNIDTAWRVDGARALFGITWVTVCASSLPSATTGATSVKNFAKFIARFVLSTGSARDELERLFSRIKRASENSLALEAVFPSNLNKLMMNRKKIYNANILVHLLVAQNLVEFITGFQKNTNNKVNRSTRIYEKVKKIVHA